MISCGQPVVQSGSEYLRLTGVFYENTFDFQCKDDFELRGRSNTTGNSTVTCLETGQWDFGSLHCTGEINV